MKLAIIRIRGIRNIKPKIVKTLELLRLHKPHHCVIMEDSKYTKGMLNVAKDYLAFGPINEEVLSRLILKKGKKGAKRLSQILNPDEIKEVAKKIFAGAKVNEFLDPVFQLKPPKKGYGDIKQSYPKGELGARPDMSALIRRITA